MLTRSRGRWTRRVTALGGALAAGWMAGQAVTARGQDGLPTGAELVARHVAAIGGAQAWRGVSSLRATGTTELPAQNMRGTFEMLSARPARSILRMELGGLGTAESGFDGEVGWTLDPMVGPSLVTGGPLAEMKNDAHFDAALHPPDLVASVTTVGRVEFDGRPAYKALVIFVSGQRRDEFFDVETGLLIGTEGQSETPMGTIPMKVTLRDYRAFGVVKYPTRLIQSALGFEQHFVFETYEANTLASTAFDPPPMIRAIIRTEPWRDAALASFDETWTTINDSFYDPAFGGLDWVALRETLRPRVETAATPDAARAVIGDLLARLKRSHFALMPAAGSADDRPPAGDAMVEIDVRVMADGVVVTRVADGSDAARAGVTPGQLLLAVDDEEAGAWRRPMPDGTDSRVRALDVWRRAQRSLRGIEGSRATLRVRGREGDRTLHVTRAAARGERVVLGDLPPFFVQVSDRALATPSGRAVGLVGFNVWMASANDALAEAIDRHRAARGLVIDLRGNPGGLAAMIRGVAGHLFDGPAVLGRMKTRTSDLEFAANPRLVMPDGRRVAPYGGPVAVLVDELTASASECFAGALQSLGRARIFGRQTLGQALPASTRRLPNGDLLMYAVGDFVTATGRRLEGEGVIPDEVVPLSRQALLGGRDEPLEAALRWLDRQ